MDSNRPSTDSRNDATSWDKLLKLDLINSIWLKPIINRLPKCFQLGVGLRHVGLDLPDIALQTLDLFAQKPQIDFFSHMASPSAFILNLRDEED